MDVNGREIKLYPDIFPLVMSPKMPYLLQIDSQIASLCTQVKTTKNQTPWGVLLDYLQIFER